MRGSPSAAATADSRPPGAAFAALRHRDFRSYFLTSLLWMLGDNVEHVISYWVIYQAFHSPTLAGFAVISHWSPFLLFAVYAGALADRWDCRKIMQIGQIMMMVVSLGWGLLFLTGSLQVWHAVVLLIIHGSAAALSAPASQLIIHDMVGTEHLPSAVRMGATERQLAITLGPAVGGVLMLLLGPATGLLVNALTYVPLTVWLSMVPYTGHSRQGVQPARGGTITLSETVKVLLEVSGDRTILAMVALAGLSSLLIGNAFQAQMPGYAHDLGTDEAGLAYSALLGAYAAGAVAGGLLLEGTGLLQPRAGTAILCASLWTLALAFFAFTGSYPVALALLFAAGALNLAFGSMAQALVQLLAPSQQRGRVLGLFNTAQQGLRVGSGVTVGILGGFIGIHWSLGLSAAALLAIIVGLWAYMARQGPAHRPHT